MKFSLSLILCAVVVPWSVDSIQKSRTASLYFQRGLNQRGGAVAQQDDSDDAVAAVALYLLRSAPGRALVKFSLEILNRMDEIAPPAGGALRLAWRRVCESHLAPRWVASANRRLEARMAQVRAKHPMSIEYQRRHTYYGLAPAEVDRFLAQTYDKYSGVSPQFKKTENLGADIVRDSSSLRRIAIEKAQQRLTLSANADDEIFDEDFDHDEDDEDTFEEDEDEDDDDDDIDDDDVEEEEEADDYFEEESVYISDYSESIEIGDEDDDIAKEYSESYEDITDAELDEDTSYGDNEYDEEDTEDFDSVEETLDEENFNQFRTDDKPFQENDLTEPPAHLDDELGEDDIIVDEYALDNDLRVPEFEPFDETEHFEDNELESDSLEADEDIFEDESEEEVMDADYKNLDETNAFEESDFEIESFGASDNTLEEESILSSETDALDTSLAKLVIDSAGAEAGSSLQKSSSEQETTLEKGNNFGEQRLDASLVDIGLESSEDVADEGVSKSEEVLQADEDLDASAEEEESEPQLDSATFEEHSLDSLEFEDEDSVDEYLDEEEEDSDTVEFLDEEEDDDDSFNVDVFDEDDDDIDDDAAIEDFDEDDDEEEENEYEDGDYEDEDDEIHDDDSDEESEEGR